MRYPIDKSMLFRALRYAPHDGQRRFHTAPARFKLLIAGARYGKSLAAAREALPFLALTDTRGWIVAPSYRLGEKELRYLVGDMRALGIPIETLRFGGALGPSSLTTAWGGELLTVSAMHPENLLGEELDWLILSEAAQLKAEVWTRYLRTRLTTRRGRLIAPSTPKGVNWLHALYLRGLDPSHPDWSSFHYHTADNPLIPPEEIEEARRTLSPEEFEEQYEGGFVSRAGLVYPEFSPSRHVARIDLVGEWERYGGMDFGFANPFVCLFAALGQGGRLVVYDEYHATGRVLSAHMPFLTERGADKLSAIYADPAGRMWIEDLRSQGFPMVSSRTDVVYGIDLVRRRLLSGDDGLPGLLVDPRCVNLIREFTLYAYAEERGPDGERRPLKQHDHALDALRYLCLSLTRRVSWQRV